MSIITGTASVSHPHYVACYAIAYHQQSRYTASARSCVHARETCFKCLIAPGTRRAYTHICATIIYLLIWCSAYSVCMRGPGPRMAFGADARTHAGTFNASPRSQPLLPPLFRGAASLGARNCNCCNFNWEQSNTSGSCLFLRGGFMGLCSCVAGRYGMRQSSLIGGI